MVEGAYRQAPNDEVFDPERHVMVDKNAWVRKSAVERARKAEEEAKIRNTVIKERNWLARLLLGSKKETGFHVLHETASEDDLKDLNEEYEQGYLTKINGIYNGHQIELHEQIYDTNDFGKFTVRKIDGKEITEKDARTIWKKLKTLLEQRTKNREGLEDINTKLNLKRPVLEVLGLLPHNPSKELPETTEPKQLPEKTEGWNEFLDPNLSGLQYSKGAKGVQIRGTYNNHRLYLSHTDDIDDGESLYVKVDDRVTAPNEAKKIWEKMHALIEEEIKNKYRFEELGAGLELAEPKQLPEKTGE